MVGGPTPELLAKITGLCEVLVGGKTPAIEMAPAVLKGTTNSLLSLLLPLSSLIIGGAEVVVVLVEVEVVELVVALVHLSLCCGADGTWFSTILTVAATRVEVVVSDCALCASVVSSWPLVANVALLSLSSPLDSLGAAETWLEPSSVATVGLAEGAGVVVVLVVVVLVVVEVVEVVVDVVVVDEAEAECRLCALKPRAPLPALSARRYMDETDIRVLKCAGGGVVVLVVVEGLAAVIVVGGADTCACCTVDAAGWLKRSKSTSMEPFGLAAGSVDGMRLAW